MKTSVFRAAVSGLLIVAGLGLSACTDEHPGRGHRPHPRGDHDGGHHRGPDRSRY